MKFSLFMPMLIVAAPVWAGDMQNLKYVNTFNDYLFGDSTADRLQEIGKTSDGKPCQLDIDKADGAIILSLMDGLAGHFDTYVSFVVNEDSESSRDFAITDSDENRLAAKQTYRPSMANGVQFAETVSFLTAERPADPKVNNVIEIQITRADETISCSFAPAK